MSITLSLREAQAQLPDLVERAVKHARPCFIRRHGRPVAVLVSLRDWRRGHGGGPSGTASAQERRIRAYQRKMGQLGHEYWLPPDHQARLKHLVEKQGGGPLTGAERKELRLLLRRHEQLMVKRAAAMQAMR